MKNIFKKISLFILSFAVVFALVACGEENEKEPTNPEEEQPKTEVVNPGDIEFTDVIERPEDIPPLADLEYVKYPSKPEVAPEKGTGVPLVGEATTDSEYYRLTQEDDRITVSFYEVNRWDYVYIPLTNYNEEYQNVKITATAKNIKKIAITAVYYEMYDRGLSPITTHVGDVGDNEQFYILEFGKENLVDQSYYPLDETLGSQTVMGLCIFLDSNPAQPYYNKNTSIESTFEISSIEFLKDGDPALGDRYVAPSLNVGYLDQHYAAEKNLDTKEFTIVKSANAGLYEAATLDISNYSSEYSSFTLKFTTTNVKCLMIEILFSGGQAEWADAVDVLKVYNLTDGEHTEVIDFSFKQPLSTVTWDYVPGYYIKNYKVNGLRIFMDTFDQTQLGNGEGTLVINELEFERTEVTGTIVTKGWNTASSLITFGDDLVNGGIGSLEYLWHNSWEHVAMPVANYETASKLTVKIQAPQGINYFGIALGSGSYATGEVVLKSCDPAVPGASTTGIMTIGPKSGDVEGVVETVEYDSVNMIYTITFDFTNAVKQDKYNGKSINEMLITHLRFYFTDPNGKDRFEGSRTIRFMSVVFE